MPSSFELARERFLTAHPEVRQKMDALTVQEEEAGEIYRTGDLKEMKAATKLIESILEVLEGTDCSDE